MSTERSPSSSPNQPAKTNSKASTDSKTPTDSKASADSKTSTDSKGSASSKIPTDSKAPKRKDLDRQCWYHGLCSRESIESLMTKKGDFLVRASESQGGVTIVLSFHTGKRTLHLTIGVSQHGTFYLKAVRKPHFFMTVYDLIRYHRKHLMKLRSPNGKLGSYVLSNSVPRPKWLVQSDTVKFDADSKVGAGNFAEVYKGVFQCVGEKGPESITVAVKVLREKQGKKGEKEAKLAMIREGQVMSFYSHANIVQFYGVGCDRPQQVLLVMEFCPGGSLEKHLLAQKSNIVLGERLTFCMETALGMRYLHSQGCVHRDLAARNCLISAKGVVKIADFGLSSAEGVVDRCDMRHMPVRWMAPETLIELPIFSKKSDVWSFGMFIFEVFNEGVRAWLTDPPKRIATHVRKCKMPPLPEITPQPFKDLVGLIWTRRPSNRPPFQVIVRKLRDMRKDETLKAPPPSESSVNRLPDVCRTEDLVEEISEETAQDAYTDASTTVATEMTTTTTEGSTPVTPSVVRRRPNKQS